MIEEAMSQSDYRVFINEPEQWLIDINQKDFSADFIYCYNEAIITKAL